MAVAARIINHYKIVQHDFGPALLRAAAQTLDSEQAEEIEKNINIGAKQTARFDDFLRFVGPFTLNIDGQEAFIKNPMRAIHARHEVKEGTIYIAKKFFADWAMENGVNVRELGAEMEKRGAITGKPLVNLTLGTHMASTKTSCIKVDLTHFQHLVSQLEGDGLQGEPSPDAPQA
jgi:hypothetical protein